MQPIIASLPVLSTPAAETAAEWFERFGAELDAIDARGGMFPAEASALEEVESDPSEWPAWTDEFTVSEPLTVEELVKGVPHYGEDGPARRADADEIAGAWHCGWTLGESGYEVHQISPPEYMTGREADAFIHGVEVGAAERWADYERYLAMEEAFIRLIDPFAGVEEHELAYAGSSVSHMA
jgi:hypothetical protein